MGKFAELYRGPFQEDIFLKYFLIITSLEIHTLKTGKDMFLGGSYLVLKRMVLTVLPHLRYAVKIDIATLWIGLNPETVPEMERINKPTHFKDV